MARISVGDLARACRPWVSIASVGHLSIERGPGGEHRGDLGERAGRGQRGPSAPASRRPRSRRASSLGLGLEPDDEAERRRSSPVRPPEHRPAAGGQDRPGPAGDKLAERALLPVPERRLARARRRSTRIDRPARGLDLLVGVQERPVRDDRPGSCRRSTCRCRGSPPGPGRARGRIAACRNGSVVMLRGSARACA